MSRNRRKIKVNAKRGENEPRQTEKADVVEQLDKLRFNVKKRQKSVEKVQTSTYNMYYVIGAVAIGAIVVGFVAFSPLSSPGTTGGPNTASNYTNTCVSHSNLVAHYHVTLNIKVDGQSKILPGNIGVLGNCLRPLHTHEANNEIHIELSGGLDLPQPILRDFFDIWQEPLTNTTVWDYSGAVSMTVNGEAYNLPFGNLGLNDGQVIVINVDTS